MKRVKKNNKENKWGKKDYINLGILTLGFIIILLGIMKKGSLLASSTDWPSQYSAILDYFRTNFYHTHDLFPDFAFNLGAGENIYNYSYYGLLNPVFMLSYLLPFLKIEYFLIGITIISILCSILLFYKFLRNNKYSSYISLITSFIFMGSTSLIFHMHRHIIFVQYMPFLILAFMGVDKYFKENKSYLLTLGIIGMILTSYYYSVGLISIVIYGIYVYLKLNRKINFKKFLIDGLKFIKPIIIGILSTMVLLLPTFLVIINGREPVNVKIALKDILLPSFNLNYVLYKTYGVGLISIVIISIINLFFKKKENIFLGLILSLFIICPLFVYLLNAGMYLDAKVLIPFLPLYTLIIAIFLNDLTLDKYKLKPVLIISLIILTIGSFKMGILKYVLYLDTLITTIALLISYKYHKNIILGLTLCFISTSFTIYASRTDNLINYDSFMENNYGKQKELINNITKKDQDIYRIANQVSPTTNTNRIFSNINYYQTTIYSSTYNVLYKKFYYDIMNNPYQSRNEFILSAPKNYPFLLLMGHKYLLDTNTYMGYLEIDHKDNLKLYQNDNALPIAYASSSLINLDYFNSLNYPYNQEVILNNIIVSNKGKNNYPLHLKEVELDLKKDELAKLNYKKTNNVYIFNLDNNKTINLPLNKEISNKLLYIHFDLLESNSCDIGDISITINGITNKLTCESWKYHNQNYSFDYVIATDKIENLNLKFSKGSYKIKNIKLYTLDYGYVNNLNDKVDPFIFDYDKTKGNNIEGNINVTSDGYFVLSVPYDKGFTVYVDNKKKDYEIVNTALLGFPIRKGEHHIKIVYHAPGKMFGLILSGIGVIIYIEEIIRENKKGKRK